MIEYALRQSYEEMKTILIDAENDLNNDELKKAVNYRVGTFLHWLIDSYERLEQLAIVSKDDKSFFSGLRYANNKLKHDANTIKIYQRTGGFSFPISFPLSIPVIEFKWCVYANEDNAKYLNQFNNYVRFIQDTDIIETAEKALLIIDVINAKEI